MNIEILHLDDCPSHAALVPHLRDLLDRAGFSLPVYERRIETVADAERERFLGSPSLRIDGVDVDPGAAKRTDYGLKCRLYATDDGLRPTPPDAWVLAALQRRTSRAVEPAALPMARKPR